jgi:hypothetical protein
MHRLRSADGLVTGGRCRAAAWNSAAQRQKAILHLLNERLVSPRSELSARREYPLHPAGVPGQFDKINRLMQHHGSLLRLALANEGSRQVPEDHRLVLLLAHAEALCRLLAAATGATTKELMERMGHTSPRVALRYQHVMADRQAALATALDDLARDATTTTRAEPGGHVEGTNDDGAAGERGRQPR